MNSTGNLLLTQNDSIVWYTTSQKQARSVIAELLDSGNLVVRNDGEAIPEAYLWQSFDYPSDTQLAGMKMGRDLQHGFDWRLTSRKSLDDPSPGHLSYGLVLSDYPEFSVMNGTKKFSRIGPWNGLYFSGLPNLKFDPIIEFSYVANKDEIFYTSSSKNDSVISRVVINQTSMVFNRYLWVEKDRSWNVYESLPSDVCDNYGLCGAYGYCTTTEVFICQCLEGFSPKSPQAWNSSNWAQGCVRTKPLSCNGIHRSSRTDVFVKYTGLKLPNTAHTRLVENIDLNDCSILCWADCSCMAYTNADIREEGSGCVMWLGDLIDLKLFQAGGQDLYIQMAASELGTQHRQEKKVIIATTISATCGMLLLCTCVTCRVRRNNAEKLKRVEYIEEHVDYTDLPLFDL